MDIDAKLNSLWVRVFLPHWRSDCLKKEIRGTPDLNFEGPWGKKQGSSWHRSTQSILPAPSKFNFLAPFPLENLHFTKGHIIIRFWCRFEIMKYSSQSLKLLVLSACLCSRERANEQGFLSPLGLASCWQTSREQNRVSWGSPQAFKTKSHDFLPPSKPVVEFIMDGDIFKSRLLCLTGLSCHCFHLIYLAVCIRQKAFCPWSNRQWTCFPSESRPAGYCRGGGGDFFLRVRLPRIWSSLLWSQPTSPSKGGTRHSKAAYKELKLGTLFEIIWTPFHIVSNFFRFWHSGHLLKI